MVRIELFHFVWVFFFSLKKLFLKYYKKFIWGKNQTKPNTIRINLSECSLVVPADSPRSARLCTNSVSSQSNVSPVTKKGRIYLSKPGRDYWRDWQNCVSKIILGKKTGLSSKQDIAFISLYNYWSKTQLLPKENIVSFLELSKRVLNPTQLHHRENKSGFLVLLRDWGANQRAVNFGFFVQFRLS